ncbi:MAG: hypothetical protein U0792_10855 [Gemmataceae bacterium]
MIVALKPSQIEWQGETWLRGESIADLDEYLRQKIACPEPDDRYVHPVCSQCGGDVFSLEGTDDAMMRICPTCIVSDEPATCEAAIHYICDSEDSWDEDDAEDYACPCRKSSTFRLSVLFNHVSVDDGTGRLSRFVKWITIGGMCSRCGVVGLYAQWKVSYAPTAHLYELA